MIEAIGTAGLILAGAGLMGIVCSFFTDVALDYLGWSLGAAFTGLVMIVPALVQQEDEAKTTFMAACTQDRKEYECTAMWRSGSSRAYPMPIIVPAGTR